METLLRLRDVEARTGLRKSKLYGLMNEGDFPRPIELTPRTRAWLASEVDRWINNRITASRAAQREAA
ncbi:MAG: AlpA family phage regulatory protein [Candidatus Contendobacter sp.]|nr:AlpA family phage regulatory protein [Candidatus Contendobacter sp.]